MNINSNTLIDFLPLSFRKLQVNDVISYSHKQYWLSRVVFSIQLFLAGKGWLNETNLKNLLQGKEDVIDYLMTEIQGDHFLKTLLKVSSQIDKIAVQAKDDNLQIPLLKEIPKIDQEDVMMLRDPLANLSSSGLWKRLEQKTQVPVYLKSFEVNGRFSSIGCPKKTALKVGETYLHANIVGKDISERCFIATQAPLPIAYALFWQSVWEQEGMIIDLTAEGDRQSGVTVYYPPVIDQPEVYGAFKVDLVQESEKEGVKIHQYRMTQQATKKSKLIQRMHFDQWRDFNAVSLEHLKTLISILEKDTSGKPTWVHCRAGVGRTGTLITSFILKEKINNKEIHAGNLETALIELIINLRRHRGECFVQQAIQFKLILDYGKWLLGLTKA